MSKYKPHLLVRGEGRDETYETRFEAMEILGDTAESLINDLDDVQAKALMEAIICDDNGEELLGVMEKLREYFDDVLMARVDMHYTDEDADYGDYLYEQEKDRRLSKLDEGC